MALPNVARIPFFIGVVAIIAMAYKEFSLVPATMIIILHLVVYCLFWKWVVLKPWEFSKLNLTALPKLIGVPFFVWTVAIFILGIFTIEVLLFFRLSFTILGLGTAAYFIMLRWLLPRLWDFSECNTKKMPMWIQIPFCVWTVAIVAIVFAGIVFAVKPMYYYIALFLSVGLILGPIAYCLIWWLLRETMSTRILDARQISMNRNGGAQMFWNFLRFDVMILPILIRIKFIIEVIASVVIGIGLIVAGINDDKAALILVGIILILLGPIVARLVCERLIVIFKISDSLIEIRDLLKSRSQQVTKE